MSAGRGSSVGPLETLATGWTPVCRLDDIEVEGGVAALVEGRAVAVFRTYADEVLALSNYDPFSRASVLSRGIVGSRASGAEAVPYVASPMHKQAFDLRTGVCLSDPAKALGTWAVAVLDGRVFVGSQVTDEAPLRRPDEAPLRRPEEGLARAG